MSAKRSKSDMWMPIYIGDYLADTMRLSTLQHGAYFLLMMEYWRQGPLPNDHDELCAVARTDKKTWDKSVWPILKRFFSLEEDGFLHQKRADAERAHAEDKREKRVAAARAKHDKSSSKRCANAPANADQKEMQNACKEGDTCASPSPSHSSSLRSEDPSLRSGGHVTAPPAPSDDGSSKAKRRKTRLSDDWQPTPDEIAYAENLGLDAATVAERFRLHWLSNGDTKLDWHAAFQLWCRREIDYSRARPAGHKPSPAEHRTAVNAAWAGVPDIDGV